MPTPFNALRIMKSFSTDYLSNPFESAPLSFWQMLFPLPYRDDIERTATANGLDPFAVAGLIRQETEFNPSAASRAKAYGLMQLVLPTGREMGRKQGISVTSPRSLFEPSTNIRLGTAYLKQQLGRWNDDWTQTLAAYNAGPGRVRQWLGWGLQYHEPAEFIESIPFNETRDYVQAVLRNADMYRSIYGQKHPNAADVHDNYDTPPVYLSSLPRAARVPGGGVRTATPRPKPKRAVTSSKSTTKPAARAKAVEAKKKPVRKPAA
jgi:soluble lytic murein transglycosylase